MGGSAEPVRPTGGSDLAGPPITLGLPLTELILSRVGKRRRLAIAVWAAIPLVTPVVLLGTLAMEGQTDRVASPVDVIIPQLVLGYVVLLVLWGNGRLTRQAHALAPQLARLTQTPVRAGTSSRADVAGPVALTIGVAVVALAGWIPRFGLAASLAIAVPFVPIFLAIMTFVWTYLTLLVGLDRLGRERLLLDPFPQDTSLGLAPIGSLAFTGFGLLLASALPILVSNADDLATVVVSLGILGLAVAVLFLSMWRVHRQMAEAKARYVAEARAAYASAYEPYRASRSLATLETQAPVLGAAQALDERAHRIQEWPFDQRLVRVMSFAIAAAASTIIGRFVLILIAG
jgi:hypothetical protein